MATTPSIQLNDLTAIITGAGRGLGRAYAIDLARRGANVVVNDMDADVAAEVVQEIKDVTEGAVVAAVASVATEEGGRAIVQAALDNFGSVHIVVNNAGQTRPGFFEEQDETFLEPLLDTHVRGAFFVTRPAWSIMKTQGFGRVIMTSSPSGMFSHAAMANYAAAKGALYGLTMALANEGAPHGIQVNAILPNAQTTIQQRMPPIPGFRDDLMRVVGAERVAKRSFTQSPELVANMVTYLVSRECQISGQAFSVMAGRYARMFGGVSSGWYPTDLDATTAESVAEHIEQISALDSYTVPSSIFDEIAYAIDGVPDGDA
jgi:NAD(P)-dependent dehydrogenase (short-subunit alcohol dehydrogenase family)